MSRLKSLSKDTHVIMLWDGLKYSVLTCGSIILLGLIGKLLLLVFELAISWFGIGMGFIIGSGVCGGIIVMVVYSVYVGLNKIEELIPR